MYADLTQESNPPHPEALGGTRDGCCEVDSIKRFIREEVGALALGMDKYGVSIFNKFSLAVSAGTSALLCAGAISLGKVLNESCVAIPGSCDSYNNILLKCAVTTFAGITLLSFYRIYTD